MAADNGPVLSGYGKLRLSREYLRLRCGGDAASIFRDFLDHEAVHILKTVGERDRIECIILFPGQREMIVASIWPSADAGGLRPFPFSFFTTVAVDRSNRRHGSGLWTGMQELQRAFSDAFAEVKELPDSAAFEKTFSQQPRTLSPGPSPDECALAHRQEASGLSFREWAEGAFGNLTERFAVALWRLKNVIDQLRDRSDRFVGVKLPLAADAPVPVQVDAWLRLFRAGEEEPQWDPNLVVSPAVGRSGKMLIIFFRPLRPGILSILGRKVNMRDFVDITEFQEPASLAGFNDFHGRLLSLLDADLKMDRFADVFGDGNP